MGGAGRLGELWVNCEVVAAEKPLGIGSFLAYSIVADSRGGRMLPG